MRTISDPAKNVQVEIHKGKHITSVNGNGKISHAQYHCNVHRVNAADGWKNYFGTHEIEYALAAILGEAKNKNRKVIFYSNLKSALLKKKIQNVSMIEVKVGKETFWGVICAN